MNAQRYIVTLESAGGTRRKIWDGRRPLPIGHPARWVLESGQSGVRLRELPARSSTPSPTRLQNISANELAEGTSREAGKVRLRLQSARTLRGAHVAIASPTLGDANAAYVLHHLSGNWVLDSVRLQAGTQVVSLLGAPVFRITWQPGSEPVIETIDAEAQVGNANGGNTEVAYAGNTWRLAPASRPEDSFIPLAPAPEEADERAFRKARRASLVALLLLCSIIGLDTLFNGKTPESQSPLIPPQYAKVLLKHEKRSDNASSAQSAQQASHPAAAGLPAAASGASTARGNSSSPSQAARAVGHAKALESLVSGLVKGGMTNFLSQNDRLSHGMGSAKDMLGSGQDAGAKAGVGNGPIQVAAIQVGGTGDGRGAGGAAGIGYRSGDRAKVEGQGKGFVVGGDDDAVVDEGLTKAEVGAVIHKHRNEIRYCYAAAALRAPELEGRLGVAFRISPDGKVVVSSAESSTLPSRDLETCILTKLDGWDFPHPRGGVHVNVSYPFNFKLLGRETS